MRRENHAAIPGTNFIQVNDRSEFGDSLAAVFVGVEIGLAGAYDRQPRACTIVAHGLHAGAD